MEYKNIHYDALWPENSQLKSNKYFRYNFQFIEDSEDREPDYKHHKETIT